MDALSTLFERFLRERRYLKNVTPKTVVWYETAFLALSRAVRLSGPDDLNRSVLQDFVVRPARARPVARVLQHLPQGPQCILRVASRRGAPA